MSLPVFALDKVTLQLSWQHQFQFAGYYAAQAQGYYRDAGLDVKFVEAKPGQDPVKNALDGKAEFGVGNSGLLLQRNAGKPVVVLGVIFQHSPYVLVTQRSDSIQSVHDLIGKRMMIEPTADELRAYLKQSGVPLNRITQAQHSFDPQSLVRNKVDAVSAYATDEPFYLESTRFRYQTFSPRSAGIDFYGDNLFTTEREIKAHPARVKAFREASLRGWRYALAHPEEIADLILAQYSQRHTRDHLLYEARQMMPLIHSELIEVGYMNVGRWRHIAETYAGLGMMRQDFPLESFLYDPNPLRDLRWLYYGLGAAILLSLVAGAIAWRFASLTAALRESEERFRSAVDFSAIGMAIIGLDRRWIKVNQALCEIVGYTAEELMQLKYQQITHADDLEADMKKAWELLENKTETFQIEKRYIHKLGHTVEVQLNVSLVRDQNGAARYFIAQVQDIGERRLLQLQQVLLVLEASPDIVLMVGASGMIEYANSAAEEALKYSASELSRLAIDAVVPLRSRSSQRGTGVSFISQSRSINPAEEFHAIRKDGSKLPVEVSRSALTTEHQTRLILTMVDVSARKHIEAEFKELLNFSQTIVAKSDTGITVYLASGACVLSNDAAAGIVGATPEQNQQHNFRQCGAWAKSGLLAAADEALRTDATQHHVARMHTAYGKDIWCNASLSRIIRNGEPHLLAVFTDIAPFKAAEDNMRQAKELAEAALERAMRAERRIIDVSEETLQRFGRELHDDLGQHLTGVAFLAESLYQDLKNRDLAEMQMAARVTTLINEAVSQVRQLSQGLYPVELAEGGLKAMLVNLVASTRTIYKVQCNFTDDETWQVNDPEIAINLYRIAQEAFNNAIKHGGASRIDVVLRNTGQAREMEIADDGYGIGGKERMANKSGLGMHTMQYRASMMGATLQVMDRRDEPGTGGKHGATVVVSLPLQ